MGGSTDSLLSVTPEHWVMRQPAEHPKRAGPHSAAQRWTVGVPRQLLSKTCQHAPNGADCSSVWSQFATRAIAVGCLLGPRVSLSIIMIILGLVLNRRVVMPGRHTQQDHELRAAHLGRRDQKSRWSS
jgi:hypothetical protein